MAIKIRLSLLAVILAFTRLAEAAGTEESALVWQPWSEETFAQAKKENRFVLLDLGAVWCHWCHVMDEVTYSDPKVIALIRSRYIAVRVDQDARPDLANRYEDYGWPATIVFGPNGDEIVKRRGYIPPGPMASMLEAIIDDPTPGPSVTAETPASSPPDATRAPKQAKNLRRILLDNYDDKNLGWGRVHKFLDWDIIEYCLAESLDGDRDGLERKARETLKAHQALMDPIWGGVYQYSTDGDWKHPHYEKLMQFQAENLRIHAAAYARWGDPTYLQTAEQIRGYIKKFLTSPDGAFYTSQDADLVPGEHSGEYFALEDAARRKMGVPRVDTNIYTRENGWAINALATLSAVTGDQETLDEATRAAEWILARRSLAGGGFRHGEADAAGPYLGDSLAMGRAFLTLYSVTGHRSWLGHATSAAKFLDENFQGENAFLTSAGKSILRPKVQIDENVAVARFANLLYHYTGESNFLEMADLALRAVAAPQLAERRGFQVAGLLLAARERSMQPLQITVVGGKNDPAARALFLAALKQPVLYKRVEWWDAKDGPLPNADVEYPRLEKAAAFLCTDRSCSAPVFEAAKLTTAQPNSRK